MIFPWFSHDFPKRFVRAAAAPGAVPWDPLGSWAAGDAPPGAPEAPGRGKGRVFFLEKNLVIHTDFIVIYSDLQWFIVIHSDFIVIYSDL